jgi:hypothetical protein
VAKEECRHSVLLVLGKEAALVEVLVKLARHLVHPQAQFLLNKVKDNLEFLL